MLVHRGASKGSMPRVGRTRRRYCLSPCRRVLAEAVIRSGWGDEPTGSDFPRWALCHRPQFIPARPGSADFQLQSAHFRPVLCPLRLLTPNEQIEEVVLRLRQWCAIVRRCHRRTPMLYPSVQDRYYGNMAATPSFRTLTNHLARTAWNRKRCPMNFLPRCSACGAPPSPKRLTNCSVPD